MSDSLSYENNPNNFRGDNKYEELLDERDTLLRKLVEAGARVRELTYGLQYIERHGCIDDQQYAGSVLTKIGNPERMT